MQFRLIFTKIWLHGDSLGSLENLDNTFEFADPEYLTLHAKIV